MVLHLHVSCEGEVGLFLTGSFSMKLGCFLQTAFLRSWAAVYIPFLYEIRLLYRIDFVILRH